MPYKKSIKQVHCLVIASGINKRDKAYSGLSMNGKTATLTTLNISPIFAAEIKQRWR